MNGQRTAIVLGAGASYCYQGGAAGVPTQADIIGRLFFGAHAGSGTGFPSFVGPSGLKHSQGLASFLRSRFEIPEELTKPNEKMDYWPALQAKGYNLESLYAELEAALADRRDLLADFEAIVRTAVAEPTGDRAAALVCPNHRRICEALEPGDWILNFNWDSVMADTLLYYSHFWFPVDGFGVPVQALLLPPVQKRLAVESLVKMFHLHGSIVLFEGEGSDPGPMYLYLGPRQYSVGTGLVAITGMEPRPGSSVTVRTPGMEQTQRLMRGDIFIDEKWFSPIFIPPSKHKVAHPHPYALRLRMQIHARLPSVRRVIIAGYSFPEADTEHLTRLFVPDVLPGNLELQVINPENSSNDFRARVRRVFGELADRADYAVDDFRAYCGSLPAPIGEVDAGPLSEE